MGRDALHEGVGGARGSKRTEREETGVGTQGVGSGVAHRGRREGSRQGREDGPGDRPQHLMSSLDVSSLLRYWEGYRRNKIQPLS